MNRLVICIVLTLISYSCSTTSKSTLSNSKKTPKTYLALGDSYTIGESVIQANTYPFLLVDHFNKQSINFGTPTVIAKTGWRTDELLEQVLEIPSDKKFDLVSLLIGVNNQYQNRDIELFKEEFPELLKKAIAHSKKGVKNIFVFSIPDYSVVPFAEGKNKRQISSQIASYNQLCKSFCEQYGIAFYDITPISKQAENNPDLIATDLLHPSGKMYDLWVKQYIEKIIQNHL